MRSKFTVGFILLLTGSSFPVSAGENWQGGYFGVNAGAAFLNNVHTLGAINQFNLNGTNYNQGVLIPANMKQTGAKGSVAVQAGYNL